MIQETIKAVKEAEAKADALIADAKKQAEEIEKACESDIAAMKADAVVKAKEAAAKAMDKAKAEGEKALIKAAQDAEDLVKKIREDARPKLSDAASAVIEELLKD